MIHGTVVNQEILHNGETKMNLPFGLDLGFDTKKLQRLAGSLAKVFAISANQKQSDFQSGPETALLVANPT